MHNNQGDVDTPGPAPPLWLQQGLQNGRRAAEHLQQSVARLFGGHPSPSPPAPHPSAPTRASPRFPPGTNSSTTAKWDAAASGVSRTPLSSNIKDSPSASATIVAAQAVAAAGQTGNSTTEGDLLTAPPAVPSTSRSSFVQSVEDDDLQSLSAPSSISHIPPGGGRYSELGRDASAPPDRKAELGRATWLLLHTLAAQYPARPSRQQQRDARTLIDCLTRVYPCGDCARHFSEIVKRDPPTVHSDVELQQWLCRAHNAVNRSLSKPAFDCALVGSRWSALDCGEGDDGGSSCDLRIGRRW